MTFKELVDKLQSARIESPRIEAEILFEHFLGIGSAQIPLVYGEDFQSDELSEAVGKRVKHTPLQYILGKWEFYGLEFEVNENCLCPRPDTEILVERAIGLLPSSARFLELCTGSGCISVSIIKARPDLSGIATDKFEKTLGVAKRNAKKHGLSDKLSFELSDLFDDPKFLKEGTLDAIISNPPYIPRSEIQKLSDEVKKEPLAALDGGEDGLDFYRHITKNYAKYLKNDGIIAYEIGFDQDDALRKIAEENGFCTEIIKDLGGQARVAILRKA